ncbi:PREDICTED: uncharacterized protein LOC108750466 [Trachymyrmex septentrionalis]|uniref:uncharacterized protein LOC108750466 n=1 Tax=Trachymyrmex septentrionalis TaxID=34720 RepID=UPI00084F39BC|nr:PREDICTED: uncharacterized protein LOC108750466 [Trachymyrmex septentrionalis]
MFDFAPNFYSRTAVYFTDKSIFSIRYTKKRLRIPTRMLSRNIRTESGRSGTSFTIEPVYGIDQSSRFFLVSLVSRSRTLSPWIKNVEYHTKPAYSNVSTCDIS